MSFLIRQTLAAIILLAVILAWWYPPPVILSLELVQWEERLAHRYNPEKKRQGLYFRPQDDPPPLPEFIAAQTAGTTITSTDPDWAKIVHSLATSDQKMHYFIPDLSLFKSLTEKNRYLLWQGDQDIYYLEYHFLAPPDFGQHDLPLDLKYPLRAWWPFFLAAMALAVVLFFWRSKQGGLMAQSTPAKGLGWSAFLLIVCSGTILWPFVYNSLGTDTSYASITIGTLLCLGGLVALGLFGRQLVLLKKILAKDHLAHFTYSPEEWTTFAHWNYEREVLEKKLLWWVILVITLVVSLGLFLVTLDIEGALWIFGGFMFLMLVLRILAVGIPKASYKRHLSTTGQVYIHKEGVYLNGSVHSWNVPGTRLDKVIFKTKPLAHLEIIYSYFILMGKFRYPKRNYTTVRVPIPSGQEALATTIPKQLMSR